MARHSTLAACCFLLALTATIDSCSTNSTKTPASPPGQAQATPQRPVASAPAASQANAPTNSRWVVHNWRSPNSVDQPDCHSLEYFENDPRYPEAVDHTVRSMRTGEINGFTIQTIIINLEFGESSSQDSKYIKMIVVERKPGEFCKIYDDLDDSTTMETVTTASIMYFDSGQVLASKDQISNTCDYCPRVTNWKEMYWTFDDDGPISFDLREIDDVLQKILPREMSFWDGTPIDLQELAFSRGFDLATFTYESRVSCSDRCDSGGSITVQFALKNHHVTIVDQKYVPPHLSPIRVSEEEQAAKLILRVPPVCPPEARQACAQGDGVSLNVLVDPDGKVTEVHGGGRVALIPAAEEAVRQWRYEPTMVDGKPVPVATSVHLTFSLGQ